MKIRKVDGYWNYDKSEFEGPSALFEDDDRLEKLWDTQYSLADYSAPTNFKSYDELKKRLDTVLAGTTKVGSVVDTIEDEPVEKTVTIDTKEEPAPTVSVDDDEDTTSYFEKLAADES